ncbi:MAG: GTP 3',8-cyclase MoaA [Planctomycetota bacterium]|nr:GTP 3',8-cyclase MoaA [Planctomycetota bacterium]
MYPVVDTLGRPLGNLRISVTDRCNLRCAYCMPEEEYTWLPRADILRFEEVSRLVDAFIAVGADRVRLTGGEPLMRRDLASLVRMLADKPALRDIALTTNGLLLAGEARALKAAGLARVTISLDTLQPDRFRTLTRRDGHEHVLAGIEAVATEGFRNTKIDTVVMRGVNDDELVALVQWAQKRDAEIRFIEYMDVGGATRWSMDAVVSRTQMLSTLAEAFGPITPIAADSTAPAERFMLADGYVFGIIASTTAPFCSACDRSRLTADGQWFRCLYAARGTDLRTPLRAGASIDELAGLLQHHWTARNDRGAEERLATSARSALANSETLRANPHLEMHTRGG